ncbi:hypothetical protein JHK86_036043 [Glycine max]|nr:hypothetical protein JHK86_043929 [Glycine max]KAG4937793.1 hypothetical protein JHK86_043934 [Glycine max]KAG4937799.1 hypothetical protein JHK86_043940 [Glycine max]KAG4938808.1 hypothetical protein JHK86_044949 [Glycine max]KAG4976569.1 hypothetical protein JHK86_036043 [Glycine max]
MSRRLILQQARGQSPEPPPTAWELTVSCSISLPDGGSFHPSLTRPTIDNNSPPNTAHNFHRTVLSKEQLFSKSQKVLSWNPILTKDSCGSGGSSYRRTGNGELPPPPFFFRPTLCS